MRDSNLRGGEGRRGGGEVFNRRGSGNTLLAPHTALTILFAVFGFEMEMLFGIVEMFSIL